MTLVRRVFRTREIRPVPDLLLETNHIWAVAGELGAVTFETAMMFEAEIDGRKVKQWGDAFLRTHMPREQMLEGWDLLGGQPDKRCPILEVDCWVAHADESAVELKYRWQAADFDDEIIYAELEQIYRKRV
ncbi:hypothetical protein [Nonomuraea sp. SYSU D8015]|uniref:hypothetical protein n=1 Tax=Nonomuraea sp. SYSU D8015 TaxID=2593644 RepID=UPI0016609DA7|nr:hypothetical protein [Nonomuraea sp. SYSU D8015]